MSAIYKCNWCDKKIMKHVNSKYQFEYVYKKLYKNPNEGTFRIRLEIKALQEDLDVCDECLNKIKTEAIKKLLNTKLE